VRAFLAICSGTSTIGGDTLMVGDKGSMVDGGTHTVSSGTKMITKPP
jgi:hypothetical protein